MTRVRLKTFCIFTSRSIKSRVMTGLQPRLAIVQWFEAAYWWSTDTNEQTKLGQMKVGPLSIGNLYRLQVYNVVGTRSNRVQ